jgi:hypothetical protein
MLYTQFFAEMQYSKTLPEQMLNFPGVQRANPVAHQFLFW